MESDLLDLDYKRLPSRRRARARKLAATYADLEEALRLWPDGDRWMLVAMGQPHGLQTPEELREQAERSCPEPDYRADWEGFAADHGVRSLLTHPPYSFRRITGLPSRWSYGSLLSELQRSHRYRTEAPGILLDAIESRHRALVHEVENRGRWESKCADVVLEPLRADVLVRYRAERRKQVPFRIDSVKHVSTRDRISIDTHGGTEIEFEPTDFQACGVAGLAAILEYLTGSDAADLSQILSSPVWLRDLERLDDSLRTVAPPPDDKPFLGWLIKAQHNSMQVSPVRCRPKKRGDGFLMRQVTDVPLALCTEPQDEQVFSLHRQSTPAAALLPLLQGHPRVFFGHRGGRRVEVKSAAVRVGMLDQGDTVRLCLLLGERPAVDTDDAQIHRAGELLVRHTTGAVEFGMMTRAHRQLRQKTATRQIEVPKEQIGELLSRMPAWSRQLEIHADAGVLGPGVDADLRPLVRLEMREGGLAVEVLLQPLPELPAEVPGQGSEVLAAVRDGEPVHVQRDFEAELQAVDAALAPLCLPNHREGHRWFLQDMQQILALVETAKDLSETLRIRWGGPAPTVFGRRATAEDLALRVDPGRDWFGVGGAIKLGKKSLSLERLLAAVAEGHQFVPLSKGQWLGLDHGLRTQLEALDKIGGHGNGLSLTALHAPLLDPLIDAGATLDAPPEWLTMRQRILDAAGLEPSPPDQLQATLRGYQIEGIQWLLRMSTWAPGVCLADDMGLGKTLQALAALLTRVETPALVVAPASVLINWTREMARFTPTLTPRLYWGTGRSLTDPAPGDVFLTTYGTLQRDAETLAAIEFGTVVLDEAQAIKNPSALRSKAAYGLNAGFRIALSGTPVENRTEELWSLFRFLAPGLLGGRTRFQRTFVAPIEGKSDAGARGALARVVGPFLLRRTKGEVARDLPARTEILRRVELSDAEKALYERTRLECILRMESEPKGGLAAATELLKLRKLACHPRLYDKGSPVRSSKLIAVMQTLNELRDSGHKALVFSQFTSHLALVREALDDHGFTACYLDGSMSLNQRQQEVDRFQAGEADVFLISLKAGGTGLNLTAANYVLHLDPWWNPAAEDQATDRAHRIGQRQAVTVLRFVAAGTVEEQIVAMHAEKRELAAALLSGQSGGKKMSPEVLLDLLNTPMEQVVALPDPKPVPVPDPVPPTADPAPPEPRSTDAAAETEFSGLRARFAAHLRAQGRKPATVRAYRNALTNLVSTLPDCKPETLREHGPAYVALAKTGQGVAKSDKVYAQPALRQVLQMLDMS